MLFHRGGNSNFFPSLPPSAQSIASAVGALPGANGAVGLPLGRGVDGVEPAASATSDPPHNLTYCPQCGLPVLNNSARVIKEACGHYKCRQCLLIEERGCGQCNAQNSARGGPPVPTMESAHIQPLTLQPRQIPHAQPPPQQQQRHQQPHLLLPHQQPIGDGNLAHCSMITAPLQEHSEPPNVPFYGGKGVKQEGVDPLEDSHKQQQQASRAAAGEPMKEDPLGSCPQPQQPQQQQESQQPQQPCQPTLQSPSYLPPLERRSVSRQNSLHELSLANGAEGTVATQDSLPERPPTPNLDDQISGISNMTPDTLLAFAEHKARLQGANQWVFSEDFSQLDDELEWLKDEYESRIRDILANVESNNIVIQRGKLTSAQHFQQQEQKKRNAQIPTTTSSTPSQPARRETFTRSLSIPHKKACRMRREEPSKAAPAHPAPGSVTRTTAPAPAATTTAARPQQTGGPPAKRAKRKRNSIGHENYAHIVKKEELDPPEYLCLICSRQFKNRLNIRYHIACADKSAGHNCKECDRIFKSSSHLTYHMRTAHGGEKPYKCRFCEKAFAQSVKLKRHERTHTGERPFKCETCAHTFTTKYNLKEHENIHKAEKPYVCSTCNAGFADRNNLRRHESTHDSARSRSSLGRNAQAVTCSQCQRSFSNSRELSQHVEIAHPPPTSGSSTATGVGDNRGLLKPPPTLRTPLRSALSNASESKPFSCKLCSWSFSTREGLSQHTSERHGSHMVTDSAALVPHLHARPFKIIDEKIKKQQQRQQQEAKANPPALASLPEIRKQSNIFDHFHRMYKHFNGGASFPSERLPKADVAPPSPMEDTFTQPSAQHPSNGYVNLNLGPAPNPLSAPQNTIDPNSNIQVQIGLSPPPSDSAFGGSSNGLLTTSMSDGIVGPRTPSPNIAPNFSMTPAAQQATAAGLGFPASLLALRRDACLKLKNLLRSVPKDEIPTVVQKLSSRERRALNEILRCDAETARGRAHQPKPINIDKDDTPSEYSSGGSKKEFLNRYKRQVIYESASSSASSVSFPCASQSISKSERQRMLEDFGPEVKGASTRFTDHEFPQPNIQESLQKKAMSSFDGIMQGIHDIISSQAEQPDAKMSTGSVEVPEEHTDDTRVRKTQRGLRKVPLIFDDED